MRAPQASAWLLPQVSRRTAVTTVAVSTVCTSPSALGWRNSITQWCVERLARAGRASTANGTDAKTAAKLTVSGRAHPSGQGAVNAVQHGGRSDAAKRPDHVIPGQVRCPGKGIPAPWRKRDGGVKKMGPVIVSCVRVVMQPVMSSVCFQPWHFAVFSVTPARKYQQRPAPCPRT